MIDASNGRAFVDAEPGSPDLRPNLFVLLAGSAATALLSFAFLPSPAAVASTLLGALMIAGADVDARTLLLPDVVTYGATISGIAFAPLLSGQEPLVGLANAILRAAGAALILLALRGAYRRLRGREGLGLGDVKLGAAIGAWLSLQLTPVCFALAAAAALLSVAAHARKQAIDQMRLPFGAFLCPALWLIFFVDALPS
jgi:leader peptidase (prepilin peptidase)/N-methyltransferase